MEEKVVQEGLLLLLLKGLGQWYSPVSQLAVGLAFQLPSFFCFYKVTDSRPADALSEDGLQWDTAASGPKSVLSST